MRILPVCPSAQLILFEKLEHFQKYNRPAFANPKKKTTRLRRPWRQIAKTEVERDLVEGETPLDTTACWFSP